jgi:drug/metabolite transporter (DMT)-like permease
MGPTDHLPNNANPPAQPLPAEAVLQALSQDLEVLRQKVSTQLGEEIAYLQSRKQRLMADIETLEGDFSELQAQHQQLQSSHSQALSEQQQAQQQVWAKRLAQALATHLQARLETSLVPPGGLEGVDATASFAAASQRLAALDVTLHSALQVLQQDLNSYQSSLSQQVSRMQNMEQQGEAILEALVTRLSQQLQRQMVQPSVALGGAPTQAALTGHRAIQLPPSAGVADGLGDSSYRANAPMAQLPSLAYPATSGLGPGRAGGAPPKRTLLGSGPGLSSNPVPRSTQAPRPELTAARSNLQAGLILVMLSTLALSIHNVLVGLIGYGGQVFGRFPVASIFPLTIPNSLMLLWLRMVVVVPLMALVATQLRPSVGQEIGRLLSDRNRRPLIQVLASGSFLFLSQVLIYKAISDVGPGVAVTLLFMYPLLTVPLAWFLFGDRPTPLRLVVMFAITMGIVFTALPRIYSDIGGSGIHLWGVGAAMLSSVAFALYLVTMQLCFKGLHPVPVSLMQFSTVFGLTSLILIVGSFFGLEPSEPSSPLGLYLGGLMLGFLTLLGYLFNNYGVKLMGAAQASIVAASGPVVTAILAYLITPGEKSTLQFIQWMGVVLVTLGVVSLSLERWANLRRPAQQPDQA